MLLIASYTNIVQHKHTNFLVVQPSFVFIWDIVKTIRKNLQREEHRERKRNTKCKIEGAYIIVPSPQPPNHLQPNSDTNWNLIPLCLHFDPKVNNTYFSISSQTESCVSVSNGPTMQKSLLFVGSTCSKLSCGKVRIS